MKCTLGTVLTLALLLPQTSYSDEKPQPHFYRLDFVSQELDGTRVVNSREYSLVCSTNCDVRANSEVPVVVSSLSNTTAQYQNYNIGVSIECRNVHEVDGDLSLTINSGISTLQSESDAKMPPVVRKQGWVGEALVRLRKQTVIFSSDDLTSKHKLQLVLTATPIK